MAMFYIHKTTCISPQESFGAIDLERVHLSVNNKLQVIEPAYQDVPPALLRRMGKAVRIGVGAALALMKQAAVEGIIIGTANGGMEDCIKFLNQIISYEEGLLTPGNFVQSTANSIASQLGMLSSNLGYNSTHVHRGLAFEHAAIDAAMITKESPGKQYLLGGVDEISAYNYTIDCLGGWFNTAPASSADLYAPGNHPSMAGEGAAMFLVDDNPQMAVAEMQAITTIHTTNVNKVKLHLLEFLDMHLSANDRIDLFLSGENGDQRHQPFYDACESVMENSRVARFKHMSGEYATASSMALWLACEILQTGKIPAHMLKYASPGGRLQKILIYNNYRERQHGFMLVNLVQPAF